MSDSTAIAWTDATWNPIVGCSRASTGCEHCYAERMAVRLEAMGTPAYQGLTRGGRWTGETRLVESALAAPLHWRKPRRVFVCSMGDLFHPSVPDEWIDRVFGVMHACEYFGNAAGDAWPGHVFQALTKRARRMREYLTQDRREQWADWAVHYGGGANPDRLHDQIRFRTTPHPRIWLGTTAEDQERADERIPELLATPAAVRFVSAEPLLGPVCLTDILVPAGILKPLVGLLWEPVDNGPPGLTVKGPRGARLDWVIVGGESGPGARACDVEWIRSVLHQCRQAGVPAFCKQLGAAASDPVNGLAGAALRVDPDAAALVSRRLTDRKGGDPSEWPADLRVREWPEEVHD